jgi:hypothetical protein
LVRGQEKGLEVLMVGTRKVAEDWVLPVLEKRAGEGTDSSYVWYERNRKGLGSTYEAAIGSRT